MARVRPVDSMPALVERLLVELGEDPSRDGLKATPARVSRSLRELNDGYHTDVDELFRGAVFEQDYDELLSFATFLSTASASTTCCRSSARARSATCARAT